MLMDSSANPGPLDPSVLYDQDKHVSSAVWDGQERGALRCHEHTSKLGEWKLTPKQIELVEKAGFGYLRKIPAISLDNPLISALVERWRRETNTFHLTVGEMTVTLQDVALLLGLAIDGNPVIGITYTTCSSVCERYLGKAPDSNYASGGMVKLSWLKEFFSDCPEDAPIEEVERRTRAYLLYLVGSTIFSTTTGNKVPVMYLPLFEDFEEAGRYAWGAAALAFLYRALGNASVKSQSTICGCLTLLQCWNYYHLNIGRPKLNRDPIHDHFPFVLRWKGKQSGPTTNRDVVFYRKALDSLKPCDVEWLPYKFMDSTVIPEDIRNTLGLGRSKTMLICFDKAERHVPDRCLRQYGMLQLIPEDVARWVRKSRGVDGGVDLSGKMESELNEWADRHMNIFNGDDGVDESEYMHWYFNITRRIVGRPISLSTEFQRTISGLREIAYLAESFSTKGFDPQQYESMSRIRSIAQECLRDQVGVPAALPESPQSEIGKRIRGKERVRRKCSGKRRRSNDPLDDNLGSEDESQFGPIVEVDQLELHQTDGEADQLQICHAVSMDEDAQLCDADDKVVDDMHLFYASNDADESQLCDATKTNEIHDSLLHNANKTIEVFEPHHDGSCNHIDDSQMSYIVGESDSLTGKLVVEFAQKSPDAEEAVKHSEIFDAANVVDEIQIHDAADKFDGSQFYDVTDVTKHSDNCDAVDEVNDSLVRDIAEEDNDSEIRDAAASEVNPQINSTAHSHTHDADDEIKTSQLTHAGDGSTCEIIKEAIDAVIIQSSLETSEGVPHQDEVLS